MKILLSLLLLFASCKPEKKDFFLPTSTQEPGIYLEFGNWKRDVSVSFPSPQENWGLSLQKGNQSFCFSSHSPYFENLEKGPKLSLCFPSDSDKESQALSLLEEYENSSVIQTQVNWTGIGFNGKIQFWSETKLLKLLESPGLSFFLGEKRLCDKAREVYPFFGSKQLCTSGLAKNTETSFSLPYFSILLSDSLVHLFFPEPNFRSGSSRKYLGIEIEITDTISEKLDLFFLEISDKQRSFVSECKPSLIRFTEGNGISSSHTGKFLEVNSVVDHTTCLNDFEIQAGNVRTQAHHPTGYLLPDAYLLLIPEDSRLEGEVYPNLPWKDIRSGATLKLIQNDLEDTWETNSLGFALSDSEFSSGRGGVTCNHRKTISFSKSYCGTPGFSNQHSQKEKLCPANEFRISEMNFTGIILDSKLEQKAKFLELEFMGNPDCINDYLEIQIGNRNHPFIVEGIDWRINPLLLIGSKIYLQHKNLLDRDLGSWNERQSINLTIGTGDTVSLYTPSPNFVFFPKTKQTVYSMVPQEGSFTHHPINSSNIENAMSPGEKNPIRVFPKLEEAKEFHLSEFNSRGSYTATESFPDDKFLEVFTPYQTSIDLEVHYRHHSFFYKLPIESKYTLLAKNAQVCFESDYLFIDSRVQFPAEDVRWRLLIGNQLIEERIFTRTHESGFENRSSRIRASFGASILGKPWKNSAFSHSSLRPDCQGFTFVSPGFPNEFEPFFENFQFGAWKIFYPESFLQKAQEIIAYSQSPSIFQKFSIFPKENPYIFQSQFPDNANLFYIHTQNSKEFTMHQREKVLIQAVLPNPQNSQNEWVLVCNHSNFTLNVNELEIIDHGFSDLLTPFGVRFSNRQLTSDPDFDERMSVLNPNSCAYIIDPDAVNPFLLKQGSPPMPIWTVRSDGAIGNGISNSEGVDLYLIRDENRIHLHSFRNQFSPNPWTDPAGRDEIFNLKPEKVGQNRDEYEILKAF